MERLNFPLRALLWSRKAVFFGVLVTIVLLVNSFTMVQKASRGHSDIGVFYQSALRLNHGGGAEVYKIRTEDKGWFRCIPPAGLAFFQPLARFSPGISGFLWMLFNWVMLGAALVMLHRFLGRLDHQRRLYASLFPWMAILLVLMSVGSIQVGQFSLLFTTCWIAYLLAATRNRGFWMGLALSLPSAIKIYPALMLMVPLAVKGRRSWKEIGFFVLGLVIFCAIIPTLFNGTRVVELSRSFVREVVFNPAGRMSEDLQVGSVSNQGLESIFLRYLSYDPPFHSQFAHFPHGNWPKEQVLRLASGVRLAILGISFGVVWRWRRRSLHHPIYGTLCMVALASAVLYLTMPGPKARYAIYAFVAFLPLFGSVAAAARLNRRVSYRLRATLMVVCIAFILQFIPNVMRAYGCGFIGALFLWGTNLWLLIKQSKGSNEGCALG